MGLIGESIESIRSIQIRQILTQLITLGMIVTSALIMWKGLMCITGSESPVVVVLSGSMEPGFKRGDILFLHMSKEPIRAGEIVVFNIDGREIPIVHRVIKVHERQETGEVDVLTKGDNNFGDDRLLYAHGQLWLHRHHIMGRAVGFLPYVGWVTIIMTEQPIIKFSRFFTNIMERMDARKLSSKIIYICLFPVVLFLPVPRSMHSDTSCGFLHWMHVVWLRLESKELLFT